LWRGFMASLLYDIGVYGFAARATNPDQACRPHAVIQNNFERVSELFQSGLH